MQHDVGWNIFTTRFPRVKEELTAKGWEIDTLFGRTRLIRKS